MMTNNDKCNPVSQTCYQQIKEAVVLWSKNTCFFEGVHLYPCPMTEPHLRLYGVCLSTVHYLFLLPSLFHGSHL